MESRRTWAMLNNLSERGSLSIPTWLALVEDKLRSTLQPESQLLARFLKLKNEVDLEGTGDPAVTANRLRDIQSECTGVILAARGLTMPGADDPSLDSEVERIIQREYFKSWPFRFVIIGFGLVLALVTGVEGFNLYQQVQAVHRLVDQAKEYVDTSKNQIAEAKSVIANRQAEMALLVLQGDQELVKMRLKALQDVDAARTTTIAEVQERGRKATEDIAGMGTKGVKQVEDQATHSANDVGERTKLSLSEIDAEVKKDRETLATAIQAAVRSLEASKHPWVPVLLWSTAKWWLIVLLSLIASIAAWLNSVVSLRYAARVPTLILASSNVVLVAAVILLVYWRG